MAKPRIQARQSFVRSSFVGYSKRHGTVSIAESRLEVDYARRKTYELSSDSIFKMQPEPLVHICNGRVVNYTPDGIDNEYVDEVKHVKDTQSDDFKNKTRFLTDEYAKQNKTFRVITNRDLRRGYEAENLAQLYPSLSHPSPINEFSALTKDLENKGYSINELNQIADTKNIERIFVKRALAHKLFECDLTDEWFKLVLTWK